MDNLLEIYAPYDYRPNVPWWISSVCIYCRGLLIYWYNIITLLGTGGSVPYFQQEGYLFSYVGC